MSEDQHAKRDILGQPLSNKDLPNGQRLQNSLVVDKIDQLLEHYNFDFATLLETFIDFGTDRHLISKEEIISLLENRFQLEPGDSRMSRFNSTQALKQYCREKYKKNEGMFTRPPKNSHSKEEFVLWAKQNGIDISHFRTRSYNKRNDISSSIYDDSNGDSSLTDDEGTDNTDSTAETHKSIKINNLLN